MYCVECGEALGSILERMRKVCSVCYVGHRFQTGHRPADLAPARSRDEEGAERSPSWGLAGHGDGAHDSNRIVLHIPLGDPMVDPAMRGVMEEMAAQIRAQGKHLEARMSRTTQVIGRAMRAVARARSVRDRTATLLARLESTWGIGPGRTPETPACPPRWEPIVPSARPWSSPDNTDSSQARLPSMSGSRIPRDDGAAPFAGDLGRPAPQTAVFDPGHDSIPL